MRDRSGSRRLGVAAIAAFAVTSGLPLAALARQAPPSTDASPWVDQPEPTDVPTGQAPASNGSGVQAQPEPLPMPPAIPAPVDKPYPGTIHSTVDATDLVRHIMAVHETIPVAHGGDLILLYPEWIPGAHGPVGPLELLDGLEFHAGSTRLAWTRDPVNMYAFHVAVPQGATSVTADYQFLSPVESSEGRVVMTPDTLNVEWTSTTLYPARYFMRDIEVAPSLRLPHGWQWGSALEAAGPGPGASPSAGDGGGDAPDGAADGAAPVPAPTNDAGSGGDLVTFRTLPLNVYFDSPLMAGRYFRRVDLAPGQTPPVHLDIVADKPSELAITPAELAAHRAIVSQAVALFGSQHYNHYDFLFAISDEMSGEGLEHHRSSENAVGLGYFADYDSRPGGRDLLTHEYTHSWNGKYRRPADLWAANLNVPERDSLLWVYEGLTQYWGQVLAARAGLWTLDQARDAFAGDAASEQAIQGRVWRPLEDTTNDPIFVRRRGQPWITWQRTEEYYTEGLLIWLDADTLIRERTQGQKSLDDFARAFFGTNDGSFVTSTYTFDDLVRALNAVMPYDWAGFLRTRLDVPNDGPPLDGITRGGYRVVYTDTPSLMEKSADAERKRQSFLYSIGLIFKDGKVATVRWNGPAYRAGLVVGDEMVSVNGRNFSAEALADAITAAKGGTTPIDMVVKSNDRVREVHVSYDGGLRYPHLQSIGNGTPPLLDAILAAKHA